MAIFKGKVPVNYLVNLLTTFLSQACSAGIIIVLTPVLQRSFSVDEFTNYGVLLNIVLFASAFDFGLNIGLLRRIIHNENAASVLVSSTFFFYLLLFALAVPVFLLLYYFDVLRTGEHFFYNAVLTALLATQTIVAALFDVVLQTKNKIFLGKLIRMGKLIAEFSILLYCSKYDSATLLLLVSALINFIYIITLFIHSRKQVNYEISIRMFRWQSTFDHMRYSFWYFLNAISVALVFYSQIIMLNQLVTKAQVAKYVLVTRFFDAIRLGSTNFTTVLFPSLAISEAKGEWGALKDTYFTVLSRVAVLAVIGLAFLLTAGKMIFQYWSGQNSGDILTLYVFLSIFTMLIVVDNVSAVFLNALRLNRGQTIISIGQGILALLIGSVLLRKMGIAGMAVGSITALAVTNLIYNPVHLVSVMKKKIRGLAIRQDDKI
ncbi:oligosaccharide flippase family protein [Sediminibacterium roseum]|uniref:Oligosaccharide flippase family protein n=1 Tax=Sediminibacterium roseum TaxID=1978412 RepID=A0ABW9ZV70_9BACT|nr:oligosaccharide flippase family protein [Sediminibacterium roseum]NCI49118.1 oligosaccharide flippase family protein [Sediminibacterium roseum]